MAAKQPQPFARIKNGSILDTLFILVALLGGILISLPLFIVMLFGYVGFRRIGASWPESWPSTFAAGLALGVLLFLLGQTTLGPIARYLEDALGGGYVEAASNVDFTDWRVYLGSLAVSIFTAGLLEEFVYRGYLLNQIAARVSNSILRWPLTIIIVNLAFAIWHFHWGLAGMVFAFEMGVALSIIYLVIGRRLWPIIIAHALYDIAIFTLRFLEISAPLPKIFGLE